MRCLRASVFPAMVLLCGGASAGDFRLPAMFWPQRGGAYELRSPRLHGWFHAEGARIEAPGAGIRFRFAGANAGTHLEGYRGLNARIATLTSSGRRLAPAYSSLWYRDLYPGIDAIYDAGGGGLKGEFRLAPGADPARIRIRYEEAKPRVAGDGSLVVACRGGELREQPPVVYQERGGRRTPVDATYRVHSDGTVGFRIGAYDRGTALVIDPAIGFSTYFGGQAFDSITAVATDAAGNVYLAGWTESADLPAAQALQPRNAGRVDAFVGKFGPSGNLIYATYIGGTGEDRAYALAVDRGGSVYVAGITGSADFPLRNAAQTRLGGGRDAFLVRLDANGGALLFGTYLGGAGTDRANAMALDAQGNVYLAGETDSTNFPLWQPFQNGNRGGIDAFVAKLSPAGGLAFSTYFGGWGDDRANGVAVNGAGEPYIAGGTDSTNLPLAGALQNHSGGGQDAFLARFNSTGTGLIYSTYLGGGGGTVGFPEMANAVAVDAGGNAWVAGTTSSVDFPVVAPLYPRPAGGGQEAFLAKVSASGASLVCSTYLGGSSVDYGNALALDGAGNVYVAGYTASLNLPLASPLQSANAGGYDAFVSEFNASGGALLMSTYLGGAGADTALALAVTPSGLWVAGQTLSYNFPLVNALQSTNTGTYGGFLLRLDTSTLPSAVSVTPASGSGIAQTFAFQFSAPGGAADLSMVYAMFDPGSGGAPCYFSYAVRDGVLYLASDTMAGTAGTVIPGSSGTAENSQCRISGAGSSAVSAGINLTLTVAMTFKTSFAGTKTVRMAAIDQKGQGSGWQNRGSWTVVGATNSPPAPVSFASSGAGSFTFTYSDPDGATDIKLAYGWFDGGATRTCYFIYEKPTNLLYLIDDNFAGTIGTITPGAGSLENSQCKLTGAGSSAAASGATLAVTVALTFKPSFAGVKNVRLAAIDNAGVSSGWVNLGTWTVSGSTNHAPVPVSFSLSGNSSFAAVYSDPDGAADLSFTYVYLDPGQGRAPCYFSYERSTSTVYLVNETQTGLSGALKLGTGAGVVANTLCSIDAAGSSATMSGNELRLLLTMRFFPAFAGGKTVLLAAVDNSNVSSGWWQAGTVNIVP